MNCMSLRCIMNEEEHHHQPHTLKHNTKKKQSKGNEEDLITKDTQITSPLEFINNT